LSKVFKKILVGLDGSEGSWKALTAAFALTKLEPDNGLWAVSVEEHLPRMPELIDELAEEKDRANAIFESLHRRAEELADEAGVQIATRKLVGHAAQGIVHFAEEGKFDLIVIGHSGHSGVWGRFLGGTADKIVRHAHCNVLVVR
jgi:nucleotide-binding universal stress UspA family protein